jgi:hypothetical protein
VPYSLNRKSRWARDGAGWLSDLVDGWSGQQRLRLCLSEADYSLAGTESVRALHRLDTSGGRLQSRWAKSGRGALLADLLAKSEEEAAEQENEEPTEEMHFQLSRPHMVSRVFAGKFFKSTHFDVLGAKVELDSFREAGGSLQQTCPNRDDLIRPGIRAGTSPPDGVGDGKRAGGGE